MSERDEQLNRVDDMISGAIHELVAGIQRGDNVTTIKGASTLVGMSVGALQSISLSLQQLVEQGERDFRAAVKAEAEAMAAPMVEQKIAEQTKRSFIGMPKNSD